MGIRAIPTSRDGCYVLTLTDSTGRVVGTCNAQGVDDIQYADGTNDVSSLTIKGAQITQNAQGQLVVSDGERTFTGAEATSALARLNRGESLAEQAAARDAAAVERTARSYRTDINPFVASSSRPAEGLRVNNALGEVVRVDERNHEVQIVAKSDTGAMLDRDANYRIRRSPDGTTTETFMQYDGRNNDCSTRNFYEVVTTADGRMTTRLHTFDPATGNYTAAATSTREALRDRAQTLETIASDDSLNARRGAAMGRWDFSEGILRSAVDQLARHNATLDSAVFTPGASVQSQQPQRDGLNNIADRQQGRWF